MQFHPKTDFKNVFNIKNFVPHSNCGHIISVYVQKVLCLIAAFSERPNETYIYGLAL